MKFIVVNFREYNGVILGGHTEYNFKLQKQVAFLITMDSMLINWDYIYLEI